MQPAGLADHSLPSKSQQPPGAPSANSQHRSARPGHCQGSWCWGRWGGGPALTQCPHSPQEPEAVVLLERLMLRWKAGLGCLGGDAWPGWD